MDAWYHRRERRSDLLTSTRPRRDRLLEYMVAILFLSLFTRVSQRLSMLVFVRGSKIPRTLIGPLGSDVVIVGGEGVLCERGMKDDLSQFTAAPDAFSY